MAVGLLLRLWVATVTERILQADELFQYLEQAHRLTYGYGYIPWEYVHGIRSWLLSGAISWVLSGCRLLGITEPTQYTLVVQFVACGVSLSVIYCAYWLGRSLFSESVGHLASVLTAVWYEMVIRSHSITPEIFGAYLLIGAITCLVVKPSYKTALLLGICVAGTIAIRLQYAPAAIVVMLVAGLYTWQQRWDRKYFLAATAGFLAVVAFTGWLDYYTWGTVFVSYTNNYLYNKVYGVSSVFRDDPVWYYFLQMTLYSGGLFVVAIAHSLLKKKPKPWLLLLMMASVVLPHMLIGHKEYRFVFAIVPMGLILTAATIDNLWQPKKRIGQMLTSAPSTLTQVRKRSGSSLSWGKFILGLTLFYAIATLIVTSIFLEPKTGYLQAYLYLHDQPNLVSVLHPNSDWHATGGYYYLHRDVPIHVNRHVENIDPDQWANYFSHIVCNHDQDPIPGFTTEAQFEHIDVRVAAQPPTQRLAVEHLYPPQRGVDGIHTPTVTPRF